MALGDCSHPLKEAAMRLSPPVADIAVMPLVDLCDDVNSEHIVCGLADMLVVNLARLPSLRVTGVKKGAPAKRAHGRALSMAGGYAYVVDGFVFGRPGAQLQVVVGVIDAATGALLLSRSYLGQGPTVVRVQAAIARSLAGDIQAALRSRRTPLPALAG